MCKYCSKVFTGDSNEDLIDLRIAMNGINVFGIQSYVYDSEGKVYIKTHLDDSNGYFIAAGTAEIKYCPVCGRKLTKES